MISEFILFRGSIGVCIGPGDMVCVAIRNWIDREFGAYRLVLFHSDELIFLIASAA
jgi:hypothetical protein